MLIIIRKTIEESPKLQDIKDKYNPKEENAKKYTPSAPCRKCGNITPQPVAICLECQKILYKLKRDIELMLTLE